MPSLVELDKALCELQNDVTQLHDQLARQQTQYRAQVNECMQMASSDVASVRHLPDAPMRQILLDVAIFKHKLEEKTATTNRLMAENDRLRSALVFAHRDRQSAMDSLARLSAKYAELKAGLFLAPTIEAIVKHEVQVQTEVASVDQAVETRQDLYKKPRLAPNHPPELKVTANPWESPLELKGVKIGLERTKPTSRTTSIERLALRPKSPVHAFSVAAAKVRNYNIRDD